jgi:hypothetical protein
MGVGLEVGELTAAGEVDGAGESLTRVAAGPVQAPTSAINPKPTHLTSVQRTLPEPGYDSRSKTGFTTWVSVSSFSC